MRINPVSRQGLVPEGGESLFEQIQIVQLHGSGRNQMENISRRNLVWLGGVGWVKRPRGCRRRSGREQLSGSRQPKPVSPWMVQMLLLLAWVMVMESKETLGRVPLVSEGMAVPKSTSLSWCKLCSLD